MDFYQEAQLEQKHIQEQLDDLDQKLARLPDGDLSVRINGHGFKWYQVTEIRRKHPTDPAADTSSGRRHHFRYIPKSQREFASQLALRKYYCGQMQDLQNRFEAISNMLTHIDRNCTHADNILSHQGMAELVRPLITKTDETVDAWLKQEYPRSSLYPENLKIPTIGNFFVRSKSEALIADLLIERGIPFRYECRLPLGTSIVYPDFTILHPDTYEIILWEHLGMLDSQTYQAEYQSKIHKYLAGGYIPYLNLITTFETETRPFDVSAADKILRMMFDR